MSRCIRTYTRALAAATVAIGSLATAGRAQTPPTPTGPAVGDMAPEFTLPGATRYGVLRDPITLSSLRGNTVVVAFFFKARTKG